MLDFITQLSTKPKQYGLYNCNIKYYITQLYSAGLLGDSEVNQNGIPNGMPIYQDLVGWVYGFHGCVGILGILDDLHGALCIHLCTINVLCTIYVPSWGFMYRYHLWWDEFAWHWLVTGGCPSSGLSKLRLQHRFFSRCRRVSGISPWLPGLVNSHILPWKDPPCY